MGEVAAAAVLSKKIKEEDPSAFIAIATRTQTGYEESQRMIPFADRHFILPLDFSFLMKKVLLRLATKVLIIVESDSWLQLLQNARKLGCYCFLVSARLSQNSYLRWKKFRFLAKPLFSCFQKICVQDRPTWERFVDLKILPAEQIIITGNLKFDTRPALLSVKQIQSMREDLKIRETDRVLVIGSTHAGEEKAILQQILPLKEKFPSLKILLVPRHPERFREVEQLLQEMDISFACYSRKEKMSGQETVILCDTMGKLRFFYQLADIAITAGSFLPALKGHNIFEPIQVGTPVLFGPYMEDQEELVSLCLAHQAGVQTSVSSVFLDVNNILTKKSVYNFLQSQGRELFYESYGSSNKTVKEIL